MQNGSMKCYWAAVACAVAVLGAGCARTHDVRVFLDETYPEKLSEWRLFTSAGPSLSPNRYVVAYEVRTSLFSNYANKHRTLWIPPGKSAAARPDGTIDFPVGTVFSKTFSITEHGKERLIETRLLVHRPKEWVGLPYVWNREQTEATLAVSGDFTTVHVTGGQIEYAIPNVNQCRSCHDQASDTVPLGPTVRNLDAATLTRLGIRGHAQERDTLETRARAYLDVNCATCHNPSGSAMAIPLDLRYEQTNSTALGINQIARKPAEDAPALRLIVTPGDPERSLLVHRMQSTRPQVGMPTIGHSAIDREGVALISGWIRAMKRS
jgi:hypothetical protein